VHEAGTYRILNGEILLLIALAVGGIGVFLFTRSMAAREQRMEARIAAIWYKEGQRQLDSGEVDSAVDSFRKATTNAPGNRSYTLALANALARDNHDAEAQQILLRLRESDPENAEFNLYLARLVAKRGEIPDAVRYYQNALYGRWTGSQVDEWKRQVRTELIAYLLAHHEHNMALSELLMLESDLPESAAAHGQVAQLFLQAGDVHHALKHYLVAAQLDPTDVRALRGAGEAAFELGDYAKANQYLEAALELDPNSETTRKLLSVTGMVLTYDPLAPHLTKEERQRRLLLNFGQSQQRLESCLSQMSNNQRNAELRSLKDEALAMEPKLHSRQLPDSELARSAVELIYQIEKAASVACGEPEGLDQALLLIGVKHGGGQ
jgi:tetratricopeptide (TPR) repeat protein